MKRNSEMVKKVGIKGGMTIKHVQGKAPANQAMGGAAEVQGDRKPNVCEVKHTRSEVK